MARRSKDAPGGAHGARPAPAGAEGAEPAEATTDHPEPARAGIEGLVAIGASAGGLEALKSFLAPIPETSRSAYVVAQHLSPAHPSHIADLLASGTRLEVVEAADGMALAAGRVLVAPPDREMTVTEDRVIVRPVGERFGPSPSIDLLFESVAQSWAERATAVVLSGTGSDGAHGLRAVKAAGGLTMAQQPEEAAFDGMPRAAIALGGVEVVDEAEELGRRLDALRGSLDDVAGAGAVEAPALAAVLAQLKRATGVDASGYKESTVRRQLQRRMALRRETDIGTYAVSLAEDPAEAQALLGALLVSVTSFFRDPEAFEGLAEAIAGIVATREPGEPMRMWVAGCATGEEVYSIAMLVAQALGFPPDLDRDLKIYGTDLDEGSLAIARKAVYPASAAASIPEPLRSAYVMQSGDEIRISDAIRQSVVFARHDMCVDPPFPRLDLVSCRNVLIYFTPGLQERVLGAFRFALKPGRVLFLGKAEHIDADVPGFVSIDSAHRLYARGDGTQSVRALPAGTPVTVTRPVRRAHAEHGFLEPALEEQVALLEALVRFTGQSFLVLDEDHRLVQIVGDVSPYCQVPQGPVTTAVAAFLRPELQDEARALFLLCRADRTPVRGQPLRVPGIDGILHLTASPLEVGGSELTVLRFEQETEAEIPVATAQRPEAFSRELARLERELLASQDTLRRSLAELQAANEELEATSEELQSSSEELQASNEELQASNEELQASNEELSTVNDELRARGEALERLNADLENIQASLSQGMVIIDRQARVTRFSPLAVRLFALVPDDIGQPLWTAPTTMPVPGLEDAVRRVIAGEPRVSIQAGDGTLAYLVQVLPYLGPNRESLGAIVTVTDVSEITLLRRAAESALSDLQAQSVLLQQQAAIDFTTGLLNRSYFTSSLQHEIDRARRSGTNIALACLDLDRFKEVNDGLGHAAGDMTLHSVGERITGVVRSTDVVGRIGGDEFALLVTGYESGEELDTMLERIVAALRQPVAAGGEEARVTASVGVAIFPEDGTSAEALIRAADAAMYAVKHGGGDAYAYFEESMNSAAAYRRTMRHEIDAALDADAFVLHFQPIVTASDGSPWGVEAMVRWDRGGRLVEAREFIPFCEVSGQIRALGRATLTQLHAQASVLADAGYGSLAVCANLSVTQLEDPQLPVAFAAWPLADGLRGIVIEIVESVFLPDHHVAFDALTELLGRGARASIDDFGSGYSNFRLLEKLRPDFIKLDRSFLGSRHSPQARHALVRSAVEVAHVIGAQVVAEGVETESQLDLLRTAGVDLLQGYAVAPPMPMPDLLAWLGARSKSA